MDLFLYPPPPRMFEACLSLTVYLIEPIPVQPCDASGTISAQFLLTTTLNPSVTLELPTAEAAAAGRPRRTGSLALFFRKVRAARGGVGGWG